MTQPSMFECSQYGTWKSTVPHNGTDTSKAAAQSVKFTSAENEARLLTWLRCLGAAGATDHEIQAHFGWTGDYGRPRRYALSQAGLIVKQGKRESLGHGVSAVWVAAESAGGGA